MVVNSIAAALKRIYASVIHAKQVSLSVSNSVSRAEGLILARFVKAAPRQMSKLLSMTLKYLFKCSQTIAKVLNRYLLH